MYQKCTKNVPKMYHKCTLNEESKMYYDKWEMYQKNRIQFYAIFVYKIYLPD
jgi:hypothetical protein